MTEITVKVGSVTGAQKGKRILLKHGYRASIKRATHIKKGEGCGYGIVTQGDANKVISILKEAGIKIISVTTDDIFR